MAKEKVAADYQNQYVDHNHGLLHGFSACVMLRVFSKLPSENFDSQNGHIRPLPIFPASSCQIPDWIQTQLGTSVTNPLIVTVVNTGSLNARAEPSTNAEIVAQLPYGTHVNVLARNEAGDWVVAITPEMERVWLFLDLLSLSSKVDVDNLPVVTGLAVDVPLYILPIDVQDW